jgi:integrase
MATTTLNSWNKRKELPRGKRFHERVAPGQFVAYKRPTSGGAGSWLARLKNKTMDILGVLGTADDGIAPDGVNVLTYTQARAKAAEWCQNQEWQSREGNLPRKTGPFTVADALEAYFKNGEQQGMKGLDRAKSSANARIIPAIGSIEVAKLTRTKIDNWLKDLANSPRLLRTRIGQPQAFAPAPKTNDEIRARKDTANRILTILKAALNYVIYHRMTQSHDKPWQEVKPFKGTTSARVRFLQPNEAARLVNVCPPDFRDLVRGALLTGCRYGELARLQCKDYDRNAQTIFIAESKSGKPRHIMLSPEGVALFDELTAKGQSPDDLVFLRNIVRSQTRDAKGKFDNTSQDYKTGAWGTDHQHRFMVAACKAAGLEYISFHELRHTYASMLVSKGLIMPIIAEQLGHSDSRMVEKHYGHLVPSYKADMFKAAMPTLGIVEPAKIQKLKIGGA